MQRVCYRERPFSYAYADEPHPLTCTELTGQEVVHDVWHQEHLQVEAIVHVPQGTLYLVGTYSTLCPVVIELNAAFMNDVVGRPAVGYPPLPMEWCETHATLTSPRLFRLYSSACIAYH